MVCLDSLGEKKLAERKILRDSGYRTRGELKKAHNGSLRTQKSINARGLHLGFQRLHSPTASQQDDAQRAADYPSSTQEYHKPRL
jgi:hypothetical protein